MRKKERRERGESDITIEAEERVRRELRERRVADQLKDLFVEVDAQGNANGTDFTIRYGRWDIHAIARDKIVQIGWRTRKAAHLSVILLAQVYG